VQRLGRQQVRGSIVHVTFRGALRATLKIAVAVWVSYGGYVVAGRQVVPIHRAHPPGTNHYVPVEFPVEFDIF